MNTTFTESCRFINTWSFSSEEIEALELALDRFIDEGNLWDADETTKDGIWLKLLRRCRNYRDATQESARSLRAEGGS